MNYFRQLSILLFSVASLTVSCNNSSSEKNKDEEIAADSGVTSIYPTEAENASPNSNATGNDSAVNVSVKTFQENSQWGYDILIDEKLYIHQPTLPSVAGNNGFKTEEDAKKAGDFVAYKIKNHIMPPSVTPEELDSLGVWKK